jgi:hypothetical protein
MSSNEGIKQSQIAGKGRNETLEIVHPLEQRRLQLKLLTSTCLKMVSRDNHFWLTGWENTVVTKTFVKQRLICIIVLWKLWWKAKFCAYLWAKPILCRFRQICLVTSFPSCGADWSSFFSARALFFWQTVSKMLNVNICWKAAFKLLTSPVHHIDDCIWLILPLSENCQWRFRLMTLIHPRSRWVQSIGPFSRDLLRKMIWQI